MKNGAYKAFMPTTPRLFSKEHFTESVEEKQIDNTIATCKLLGNSASETERELFFKTFADIIIKYGLIILNKE